MEDMGMSFQTGNNIKFWSAKKVLITGHTGFKGSWLSLWLESMGAELRGVSLDAPTKPNMFEICSLVNFVDHKIADIRDFEKLCKLINEFKPDIIFHMAAQSLVRLSYYQAAETFSTNIMGTVHVLEAARRSNSVKAIVNITTDKCYENKNQNTSYSEKDPMGGNDPYSSSKACAELVSYAYRKSFLEKEGISLATARAGNVIGGGDWATDRLVPDVLRAVENNNTVEVRSPHAVRPWQHVLEPLYGYLLLAEKLFKDGAAYSESWNLGPLEKDTKPVGWVVDELCKLWGGDARWIMHSKDNLYEAQHLKLDISKAKQRLKWVPKWSLNDALSKVVHWHKNYLDGSEMKAFSIQQINEYSLNVHER